MRHYMGATGRSAEDLRHASLGDPGVFTWPLGLIFHSMNAIERMGDGANAHTT